MNKIIAFLLSIVLVFGISVTAFAENGTPLSGEEITSEKKESAFPFWQDIAHLSYTFYVSAGKAHFSFTAASNENGITVDAQLYRDGFFNTKVGKEYKFKTDKKFLQGEMIVPLEKTGDYFVRITIKTKTTIVVKEINSNSQTQLGDVNSDGKITALDARIALRVAAKIDVMSSSQIVQFDMNGDGIITATDARTILRKAAKLA